jgi:DNA transposition AAA+ family ATPase
MMAEQEVLYNSVAPLRNVSALIALIERLATRSYSLPGMGVFYGPSGWGKTTSATYASVTFAAFTVQVKSVWTKKKLCEAILEEMGLKPARTISDMVDQIAEHLAKSDLPLLIDEADHLVSRGMIEVVRDIYEGSQSPVVMIGEELLPQKLQEWERVHGRILSWVAAQPGDMGDLDHLAGIYARDVELDPALKEHLLKVSGGSIRRICVNLDQIREFAATHGTTSVSLAEWGNKSLFTGQAPTPRRIA